ncbi:MAG: hypothetical protein ACRDP7_20065 [Trebonia sp.]
MIGGEGDGHDKDLVIIRGRNYYPQDIEHTVASSHPTLHPGGCAAFSVSASGEGEHLRRAARYLGFRVGRLAPGEADLIQPYRKELTQGDGYFQGAVLGSLADFAGGAAAGTLLPDGWINMTSLHHLAQHSPPQARPASGTRPPSGPVRTVACPAYPSTLTAWPPRRARGCPPGRPC